MWLFFFEYLNFTRGAIQKSAQKMLWIGYYRIKRISFDVMQLEG